MKENQWFFKKKETIGIPTHWCNLFLWKNHFYAYYPSDLINNYQFLLSDSTLIEFYGSDLSVKVLSSISQKDKNTVSISALTWDKKNIHYLLHIIDKRNGIAVIEYKFDEKNSDFQLVIETSKIHHFPIIVNDSRMQKELEFRFDKVNFRRLIEFSKRNK